MKECPCTRKCPDRTATCHGTCADYKEWCAIHEKDKEKERKERENSVSSQYQLEYELGRKECNGRFSK